MINGIPEVSGPTADYLTQSGWLVDSGKNFSL